MITEEKWLRIRIKRTFALKASYFGLIGNDNIEIESKKNQKLCRINHRTIFPPKWPTVELLSDFWCYQLFILNVHKGFQFNFHLKIDLSFFWNWFWILLTISMLLCHPVTNNVQIKKRNERLSIFEFWRWSNKQNIPSADGECVLVQKNRKMYFFYLICRLAVQN